MAGRPLGCQAVAGAIAAGRRRGGRGDLQPRRAAAGKPPADSHRGAAAGRFAVDCPYGQRAALAALDDRRTTRGRSRSGRPGRRGRVAGRQWRPWIRPVVVYAAGTSSLDRRRSATSYRHAVGHQGGGLQGMPSGRSLVATRRRGLAAPRRRRISLLLSRSCDCGPEFRRPPNRRPSGGPGLRRRSRSRHSLINTRFRDSSQHELILGQAS